ncbi:NAD(P)/FAD-dependent oxidoreductase [Anabaena sp. 4-3]|uniref:NAD(P)/FAD-dependent oxidoreductase n=1 Tax=Anabaena sp. 4-3 TaxID=1811979 RepID=UPI0008301C29|nr:geranylgeranyl reductase family protein [Anabaena sp. 4-3]
MNYDYDLIIVGGGPAGSTMALSAAKQGLKVLLVDQAKFPRDKICGDALTVMCLKILQEFNLIDKLLQEPHACANNMIFYSESERLIPPSMSKTKDISTSKRWIFDNVLFQAAKACTETKEGFKVENLLMKEDYVFGIQGTSEDGRKQEYTAKVVAGADGCSSVVARKLGLHQSLRQDGAVATRAYYRHLDVSGNELELYYLPECRPGYFWIFPVDQETVNVGVILFEQDFKNTGVFPSEIHRHLIQSPLLKARFLAAEPVGNIQCWYLPLAKTTRTIHGNGFILAGDAAGLIDPLIGHGIDRAMMSGKIAGELLGSICRGQDYSATALQPYADAVWKYFGFISQFAVNFRPRLQHEPLQPINSLLYKGMGKLISLDC